MLRIVKILSIASMGLAALTVVVVLVQIARGGEESVYLSQPGAVELYKEKAGGAKPTTDKTPPLVVQAKLFKLAIDPPPPPEAPKPDKAVAKAGPGKEPITEPTSEPIRPIGDPKFKLIATACYASRPDKSLALLDITSVGTKWVRVGETVEGFTVNEITESGVTLNLGDQPGKSVEMVQSPTIFPSILKGDPAAGQPVAAVTPAVSPTERIDLPPNMTARDLPKLLEKHSLQEIQAAGAASAGANPGPRVVFSTDPAAVDTKNPATGAITAGTNPAAGATTDARTPQRRGNYRSPVPATRTIPNTPVRTPAPPPTPEAQRAEIDKNIEDIRKLMNTPNPNSGGADPAEDQKAWAELLKLLEDERKNLDTGGAGGTPTLPTPAPTPAPAPTPEPSTPEPAEPAPAPQPETPSASEPTPSSPTPAESQPAVPPAEGNPPANTDNDGN